MNIPEYYLNNGNSHSCIKLPLNISKYLLKNNYLGEFKDDSEQVLSNLGIDSRFESLKLLIDAKVISLGGIPFDEVPTNGSNNILSSNSIYWALANYYTKEIINLKIEFIFETLKVDLILDNNSTYAISNKAVKQVLDILDENIHSLESTDRELFEIVENINQILETKVSNSELSNYYKRSEIDSKEEKLNLDISEIDNNLTELEEIVSRLAGLTLIVPIEEEEIDELVNLYLKLYEEN